ncbi:MAG TPA: cupin domain-containing protein [Gaiellaceae bacterium]|nr:cupin domain-containing protein [Gaiellaceae bacterium]
MRYALDSAASPDGRLFDAERGCTAFSQRLLRLRAGDCERRGEDADELLYVLEGSGTLEAGGDGLPLAPGTAGFVAAGQRWSLRADGELTVLSVLVHEPEEATRPFATVELGAVEAGRATAGREFLLGAGPELGCNSATQFVGLIPPGRAPDHFHRYDEVIYVLAGEGTLEIGGECAPLRPGTCVHLPRELVHCLANTGDSELRVLGVFRPAGSPAEAYYPDGTPAAVPAEA